MHILFRALKHAALRGSELLGTALMKLRVHFPASLGITLQPNQPVCWVWGWGGYLVLQTSLCANQSVSGSSAPPVKVWLLWLDLAGRFLRLPYPTTHPSPSHLLGRAPWTSRFAQSTFASHQPTATPSWGPEGQCKALTWQAAHLPIPLHPGKSCLWVGLGLGSARYQF